MSNAPRYRLVGYDIGTAPDENGGWVHWTDHEAEIARLTADLAESRAYALAQFFAGKMSKKPERIWSRPDYNECWHKRLEEEDVEYVRADLYAAQAEEIARLTAERDAAQSDAEALARKCAVADALVEAAGCWLNIAAHCAIEDGSCCCGDDMKNHPSPMNCGHTPVDHGSYVAAHAIKTTEVALAAWVAAQADYEARYLAAIQPDPEGRQADLAKAFCMGRDAAADRYSAGGGLQGDYPMWDFFGDAEKAIRALTPPADLAAKIGGAA